MKLKPNNDAGKANNNNCFPCQRTMNSVSSMCRNGICMFIKRCFFVLLAGIFFACGGIRLSAADTNPQAATHPLKELLLLLPPYINISIGAIDVTGFDPGGVLLKEILTFTGLDELFTDLSATPEDIAAIAFGSEILDAGQADYFVVRFKKDDAEKFMGRLMNLRGASKSGGRLSFGHARKYAEMLSHDKIFFVHASREMRNIPRSKTIRKNNLIRDLFQERQSLVMYYSWDIKTKNDFSNRESTYHTAAFAIDLINKKDHIYDMQTLFNCIDLQQVSNGLRINMRRELIRKDMKNVIRRLKVKADPKKNKIMFFTRISTWKPGEFEGLLESLDIHGRVRKNSRTKTTEKK